MRRVLITACLALAATGAEARQWTCSLTDGKGSEILYDFDWRPGRWVERSVTRNGHVQIHSIGNRPVWMVRRGPDGNWVAMYRPADDWGLYVRNDARNTDGVPVYIAILNNLKRSEPTATGICAFADQLPQRHGLREMYE